MFLGKSKLLNKILLVSVLALTYYCRNSSNQIEKKFSKEHIDPRDLIINNNPTGSEPINYVSKNWFEGFDIESFKPTKGNSDIKAIMIPHAGLKYVGNDISNQLSMVNWNNFKKIIILATNHNNNQNFQLENSIKFLNSPTESDQKISTFIFEDPAILKNNEVMNKEHSWQIVLPFLSKINKTHKISICPLIIGNENLNIDELKNFISNNPDVLLIANTDLLHCGSNYSQKCPADIKNFNLKTIANIKNSILNEESLPSIRDGISTMCGHPAIATFVRLCSKLGYKNILGESYNISSNSENDINNSVGYASLSLGKTLSYNGKTVGNDKFTNRISENSLIEIAKNAIRKDRNLISKTLPQIKLPLENFYGIFITLYDSENKLRGCIGNFQTNNNLISQIKKVAVEASKDSRFDDIKDHEIDKLKIKITILGPLIQIKESDLAETLSSENYGIRAHFGDKRSTFLASAIKENSMNNSNIVKKLQEKAKTTEELSKLEKYRCYEVNEWLRK